MWIPKNGLVFKIPAVFSFTDDLLLTETPEKKIHPTRLPKGSFNSRTRSWYHAIPAIYTCLGGLSVGGVSIACVGWEPVGVKRWRDFLQLLWLSNFWKTWGENAL